MEKFSSGTKHDRSRESDTPKNAESLEREPKTKILSIGNIDHFPEGSYGHFFQVAQDFDLEKIRKQYKDERQAKNDLYDHYSNMASEAINKGDYGYVDRNPDFAKMDSEERYREDSPEFFTKWLFERGMVRKVNVTGWDGVTPKNVEDPIDWDEFDEYMNANKSEYHKEYMKEYEAFKNKEKIERPRVRLLHMGFNDKYDQWGRTHSPESLLQIPPDFNLEKAHEQYRKEDAEIAEGYEGTVRQRDPMESFHEWLIGKGIAKEIDVVHWNGL